MEITIDNIDHHKSPWNWPLKSHLSTEARPEVKILNGLSLTLQRGQKAAVVGESGSGKSTAPWRKMVMRLYISISIYYI